VKHQTINELKQEDMFKYVNDIVIRNANKEIKFYEKQKGIKDQEIEKIKGQIKDIKEEKVYQTEDEKLESDSQINGLELKQDELKEDKKQLKNDIKKIENKIEKRKKKLRKKQEEIKEDKKQLKNDNKKIENKIEKRKQKFREKQVGME